jgi:hypothetical protein
VYLYRGAAGRRVTMPASTPSGGRLFRQRPRAPVRAHPLLHRRADFLERRRRAAGDRADDASELICAHQVDWQWASNSAIIFGLPAPGLCRRRVARNLKCVPV